MRKINSDALGKMSDNEIDFLFKKIKLEIQNIYDFRKSNKRSNREDENERLLNAQIEYCYVKREVDSRFARKESHRQYIASGPRQYEDTFLN